MEHLAESGLHGCHYQCPTTATVVVEDTEGREVQQLRLEAKQFLNTAAC
jgi:hypothetical protein